jgi:hypothetical protein
VGEERGGGGEERRDRGRGKGRRDREEVGEKRGREKRGQQKKNYKNLLYKKWDYSIIYSNYKSSAKRDFHVNIHSPKKIAAISAKNGNYKKLYTTYL